LVEIKVLLYIKYKIAGYHNHRRWWGTKIRKIIFSLAMLWFLHWFISRSGVILGLRKMMCGSWSSEVCDGAYWTL